MVVLPVLSSTDLLLDLAIARWAFSQILLHGMNEGLNSTNAWRAALR